MRRHLPLLALTVVLVAAACGSATQSGATSTSTSTSSRPAGSATSQSIAPATPAPSIGPDTTVWLCKPGIANNPCEGSLDTTSISADGITAKVTASPAAKPPIDCFYVYPTISAETTVNSDLVIGEEERGVAQAQVAQFSRTCSVYAPMYRQLTKAAIAKPSGITLATALIAYDDVYAAFQNYMAHYNNGRGIVFIGHSQGAMMLIALLRAEVDPKPAVRKLLVSALLMGGNLTVPVGKTVGGDFQNIPECGSATQTGCVVAYSSFGKTPPADAAFGRVDSNINIFSNKYTVPSQVVCVNPAAPAGGTAPLSIYLPTDLVAALDAPASQPDVTTAWTAYPNLYTGHCVSAGGATWLQIDRANGASDQRPSVTGLSTGTWGLHLLDVNIALGNLVALVRSESAAIRP
ncbi:MAG TPA: DUF3089 domain-containing protein [Candidatus Limnocylindrales bacterium]